MKLILGFLKIIFAIFASKHPAIKTARAFVKDMQAAVKEGSTERIAATLKKYNLEKIAAKVLKLKKLDDFAQILPLLDSLVITKIAALWLSEQDPEVTPEQGVALLLTREEYSKATNNANA